MIKDEKQATMFARVDEWKKSGKTMREYSSGIGLSTSCFKYWVRKKREFVGNSSQFVELIPTIQPMVATEQGSKTDESNTRVQIVFNFPNGMSVKVYG